MTERTDERTWTKGNCLHLLVYSYVLSSYFVIALTGYTITKTYYHGVAKINPLFLLLQMANTYHYYRYYYCMEMAEICHFLNYSTDMKY